VAAPSSDKNGLNDFLTDLLQSLLPRDSKVLTHVPKPFRRSARWALIGAGATCLLAWNGRLVVSTGAGLGMLWLAYTIKDSHWRAAIADLVNALEGLNQRLLLSVLSGMGATFGTYVALSIWLDTQNHWLATGMIVQGTATMGALGLLLWQNWGRWQLGAKPQPVFDLAQCLGDLTQADPLKRLIAIRQINAQIPHLPHEQAHIAEYFRILLSRETDAVICEALLAGMQLLSQSQSLKQFDRPRRTPRPQTAAQTVLPQAPEAFVPGENWAEFRPVRSRVKETVENFERN
jgi:hypothetical protein